MITEIVIFFQIVFIDLVLAADNAIIIGMVASQFKDEIIKKIIFWGIGAAIILRIVFTLIIAYLLQINGLKTIGGLLLLYIAYKLYKDVIRNEINDDKKIKVDNSNLFKAIVTIIIADVTMSLKSIQAAYSMGSMSIKAYRTETDNAGYVTAGGGNTVNEIALGLSF